MRKIPKPPPKCYTEACNGVARSNGLCTSCAHRKRKQEVESLELGRPLDDDTGEP